MGLIRPDFWIYMKNFSDVFTHIQANNGTNNGQAKELKQGVHLNPDLRTYQERTKALNLVLESLRSKDVIPALRGWRHEV